MLPGLFFPKSKLQELLDRIAECDEDKAKLKELEEQRMQLMADQEKVRRTLPIRVFLSLTRERSTECGAAGRLANQTEPQTCLGEA